MISFKPYHDLLACIIIFYPFCRWGEQGPRSPVHTGWFADVAWKWRSRELGNQSVLLLVFPFLSFLNRQCSRADAPPRLTLSPRQRPAHFPTFPDRMPGEGVLLKSSCWKCLVRTITEPLGWWLRNRNPEPVPTYGATAVFWLPC